MILKTGDISLCITLPQHSWDEVDQIDVIFGETIVIIHNSSYMQGFSDRAEKTTLVKIQKKPNINPCVLCEDIYRRLKNKEAEIDWTEEDVIKIIERVQKEIDEIMQISKE